MVRMGLPSRRHFVAAKLIEVEIGHKAAVSYQRSAMSYKLTALLLASIAQR